MNLTRIDPYDKHGALRVVVESPRGASLKFAYQPSLELFAVARALPLGVVYPYDWGFVPGTRGDDGDPLDAMVLHDFASSPGVLLTCRILGMVKVVQREGAAKPEINNRIIATPAWHSPLEPFADARDLPTAARAQLEQFFVTAAEMTGKRVNIKGWASSKAAGRFIERNLLPSSGG
jgi:inorganic pyrophosphatase